MSNDIPADMIQAVSVVPMLAPMMTEMACAKVSNPALTNETVITVVAVDDCTEAVTSIPVSIPVKRLVVMAPKTCRNWGPAIFCRASLIDFMPNMSNANEPNSLKMIVMDIIMLNSSCNMHHANQCLIHHASCNLFNLCLNGAKLQKNG